jgi:hypothetical protein
MKTTILEYVQVEIEDSLQKIKEGQDKMNRDYENGFEWGYPELIYRHKYIGRILQYFKELIGKQPERAGEWLQTNIEQISARLFRGQFQENSTSEFSRMAYRIKLEADVHLMHLYVQWQKWIADKDTPIV